MEVYTDLSWLQTHRSNADNTVVQQGEALLQWFLRIYSDASKEKCDSLTSERKHHENPYHSFIEVCKQCGFETPQTERIKKLLETAKLKYPFHPAVIRASDEWQRAQGDMFAANHTAIRGYSEMEGRDWYNQRFLPSLVLGSWQRNQLWKSVPISQGRGYRALVDAESDTMVLDEPRVAKRIEQLKRKEGQYVTDLANATHAISTHIEVCVNRVQEEVSVRINKVQMKQLIRKLEEFSEVLKAARLRIQHQEGAFIIPAAPYEETRRELGHQFEEWLKSCQQARTQSEISKNIEVVMRECEQSRSQFYDDVERDTVSEQTAEEYKKFNECRAVSAWMGSMQQLSTQFTSICTENRSIVPVMGEYAMQWREQGTKAAERVHAAVAEEKQLHPIVEAARKKRFQLGVALDVVTGSLTVAEELKAIISNTRHKNDWKATCIARVQESMKTAKEAQDPGCGHVSKMTEVEVKLNEVCKRLASRTKREVMLLIDQLDTDTQTLINTAQASMLSLRPFCVSHPSEAMLDQIVTKDQHKALLAILIELRNKATGVMRHYPELQSSEAGYLGLLDCTHKGANRTHALMWYWDMTIEWLRVAAFIGLYSN